MAVDTSKENTGSGEDPEFSNSLIIQQVKTKKITTMKEVGICELN